MSTPRTTESAPARKPARGPADPVRALMHRHRELCERAVDPLEIAAGLEAHGITDRTAARFRHRDVFSLAEELYARVPRGAEDEADEPAPELAPRAPLFGLLPGGCALATVVAAGTAHGQGRLVAVVVGTLGTCGALGITLRRGPLSGRRRVVPAARLAVCWLLVYAACGDGLLGRLLRGGPDGPWPVTATPLVGLALAVAPAAWCARLFSLLARRKLAASRSTTEFAAHTRPLVVVVTALFALAPAALLLAPGFTVGAAALGVLLFVARLLNVHGFHRAAALTLSAACATEALAAASVLVSRLPGCRLVAVPVEALGAAAVPALACGAAALTLLIRATAALSRASAHT
ncbi:hypothetical protein AB0436_16445 [Streptomyces sp. NPDC051322]|uniref:hypothetical protein n=1 Tax=Streptomyces sp. NPDC051322 TaxID=3154645 RepID=UPI00344CDAB4